MFRISSIVIIILLILSFIPTATYAKKDEKIPSLPLYKKTHKQTYRDGEVIITYKDRTTKEFQSLTKRSASDKEKEKVITEKKERIAQSLKESSQIDDLQITDQITDLGISLITSHEASTDDLIKKLHDHDLVESVEPNYLKSPAYTPVDSYFADQWAHAQSNDHDIDSTNAWDIESSGTPAVTVAVIDSGMAYDFSDLSGNMWDGNTGCVNDTGAPISCPYHGWDYDDNDNNPYDSANDIAGFQGHGTFVSSIIGATTNNGTGIAGISRYNHVKIMALRFGLDTYSEIKAINFAKNNGAKVINASFTGDSYSVAEKNAIDAFPGIIVTAAGNGGNDDIGDHNDTSPLYPCNYASTNIICVGATDDTDALTDFSNYGESVDIAAPGKDILGIQQSAYWYGDGTSFATPFVSGTAALLYAHNSSASIATIRNTILQSSDHITTLSGKISCNRRLNMHTSLQSIKAGTIPSETCTTPVYRFWSDQNQGHFYTISEEEKNIVINNYDDHVWRYEGIAFNASSASGNPIYRFWSDQNQHHFYTASAQERDQVIANYDDRVWKYEGIAFYASTSSNNPIFRFWSDQNQSHFYTASAQERDQVIANYDDYVWKYEGIAFYAY